MPVLVVNPVEGLTSGPDEPLWYVEPYMDAVFRQTGDYLLKKDRAVREEIWPATREHDIILATGHGQASAYTAYQLQRVYWVDMFRDGFQPSWLRNRKFFLLSCLAGQVLGKWLVDAGASAFLGWKVPFAFFCDYGERREGEEHPDWLYLKPAEEAMIIFAEQGPKQAYSYLVEKYTEYAEREDLPERYRAALRADRDYLVLYTRGAEVTLAPEWIGLLGFAPVVVVLGIVAANELL